MRGYYYCTTYCNQPHSLSTGRPLNHECYVLPPHALALEQRGAYEAAQRRIAAAKPLRVHSGTRCRHAWRPYREYALSGYVISLGTRCERCGKEKRRGV